MTFKRLESMCRTRGFVLKRCRVLKAFYIDPQQNKIGPSKAFKNHEKDEAAQFIRETPTHPLAKALQDIRMMVACQERKLTDAEKYVLKTCAEVL